MLLVGFVGFSIIVDDAYGLVIPLSPEELLEKSQAIFVGNITSVNVLEFEKSSTYFTEEDGIEKQVIENYTLSLDEYTVSVEEFVKNPQNSTTLTIRQPTTSIPGRVIPIGGFELGDRVLFYIQNLDDVNEYSFESFKIPKKCDANSVVLQSRLTGTDFNMLQNGMKKQDNFTANLPITFVFESDTRTLYGKSFDVEIFVSKQEDKTFSNRVFHEKISAGSKLCDWIGIAKSEFTLDSGKYLLNGNISDEDSRFSFSNQFSVVLQSPLKQSKSGIVIEEIQCRDFMVLIQKYDGSPACVKSESVSKLIERGWAKQLAFINNIADKEDESILDTNTKLVANTADNFIDANNQFALNFYSNVAEGKENNNIFFSPISISTAFAIAYEGAREDTAQQIQAIFGFVEDDNERRTEFQLFQNSLNKEDEDYSLNIANALWIKQGYQINPQFIDVAKTYYDSEVDNVDFVTDKGVDTINEWVKLKTDNKIEELLAKGSTDVLTRLVITNAIYFNGEWVYPFSPDWTSQSDFHTSQNETVKVLMMDLGARKLNYAQNDLLEVIELPYKGERLSMLVLLPKEIDGIKSLEENLTVERLSQWQESLSETQIAVFLPKFTAETKYNLKENLQNMGMTIPFDKNDADFTGINETEQLYIDEAVHKAFVNVHELGTEAAAATGLEFRLTSGPPATFRADHPFVFLIQDDETGQILFMGKVVDPSQ